LASLKKKMINYFMKKKEDEENGYYQFMRHHKPIPVEKRVSKILSQDRIHKFSLYKSKDARERISTDSKFRVRPNVSEAIQRRNNSTKFKSLNEYFSQKYKTETGSENLNK
jgi:predicted HicB family RNase H-like nuclease